MERNTFLICLLIPFSIVGARDIVEIYSDRTGVSKENITDCLEETGFTRGDLIAVLSFRLDDLKRPENKEVTTNYGCFLSCFYHRTGAMVDQVFQPEAFAAMVTRLNHNNAVRRARILKVMYRCAQAIERKDNHCEIAQGFTDCFWIALGK